jgi:hypothetical protein
MKLGVSLLAKQLIGTIRLQPIYHLVVRISLNFQKLKFLCYTEYDYHGVHNCLDISAVPSIRGVA